MHIIEGVNKKYCYAKECIWDSASKEYRNPGKCIGRLDIKDNHSEFIPNKYLKQILSIFDSEPSSLSSYEKLIVETVIEKYGVGVVKLAKIPDKLDAFAQTARAIFYGPQLIFGAITKRYKLHSFLEEAFLKQTATDILSLSWYIASEGSALSNSDSWLEYFENPRGAPMRSKDITRLLDIITTDGMMSFYKLWLTSNAGSKDDDRTLYDLTSISYYGKGIDSAELGHNRDKENLNQVNFALMCKRQTGMPLFAWPMNGSISDVCTLEDTLSIMEKLGYKPNCLMMDRGFASKANITYMLRRKYTFLQAIRVNAGWVRELIDAGKDERANPGSMIKEDGRTYYASTVKCRWEIIKYLSGRKAGSEEVCVSLYRGKKHELDIRPDDGIEVVAQYNCSFHALFCQDLVGSQRDRFMESLKEEHERLAANENADVKKELAKYFIISKQKHARHRSVEYNLDNIKQYENKYVGYVCFLTNDKTINTAKDVLSEYSTRDYIEKDFDEMKNDLDMRRLRVHSDHRMRARLFIQFIAEIYMREIRVQLRKSDECKKLTRKQIFSHIKTIYKIKFKGKYRDVQPSLSKSQRCILDAMGINVTG